MGYEYTLKVPEEYRSRVAEEAKSGIPKLLERLDPGTSSHIDISAIPEGLFICDHLSDKAIAALAFRAAVEWLLRLSPKVLVEDA